MIVWTLFRVCLWLTGALGRLSGRVACGFANWAMATMAAGEPTPVRRRAALSMLVLGRLFSHWHSDLLGLSRADLRFTWEKR